MTYIAIFIIFVFICICYKKREKFVQPMIFNPRHFIPNTSNQEKTNKLKDELYLSRINRKIVLYNRIHELNTNPFYNLKLKK